MHLAVSPTKHVQVMVLQNPSFPSLGQEAHKSGFGKGQARDRGRGSSNGHTKGLLPIPARTTY